MRVQGSIAIIAGLFIFSGIGAAQQYSFQYYGVDQGLSDLAVRSLYQSAQGFLWVSTENGVFRYDGERFQSFGRNEGLPPSNGAMFGEAPDGSLLVGGNFGLYRKEATGDQFRQIHLSGATRVMWGSGIQPDGHGTTYIATDAGLMSMARTPNGANLSLQPVNSPSHKGGLAAFGVFTEGTSLWWGCGNEICLLNDGKASVFGPGAGVPAGSWNGIKRAGNGDLWIQSTEGQVAVMRQGKTRFGNSDLPQLSGFGPRGLIKVDTDGRVIVPVGDGVAIEERGHWHFAGRSAGFRGPVYAILQDREGSVWLGLGGHGLAKWLGYGEWSYFNSDDGLGSDLAYEVTPAGDGAYWAGTDAGLFLGQKTTVGWTWKRQPGLRDTPVHTVKPDGHGKLWLGTEGKGAARLDTATGRVDWFGAKQGLTADSPYTIMIDRENRIWAASLTGLFVADGKTLQFRPADGLPSHTFCLAVVEGANGDIWAGSRDGLFHLSNGHWNRFSTTNGLSNNEILSLAADRNGDIWVGYQFGRQIDRLHSNGTKWTVTRERGSTDPKGTTYFLGFDAANRLWAGTNRGVEVRNGAHWEQYDHQDGLVWDDCNLNGFHANPDGSVWIGTSGGLALFAPKEAANQKGPPIVVLTRLTLGKEIVDPDLSKSGQTKSVDYAVNSLTARFSALTFARENAVRFRYRLAPLSADWKETRERALEFPGLPPNSYTLEIQARDGWGRWSTQSAAFSFEVRPPWWRAWWFLTLCAVLPLAIAVIALRMRGNEMRRRERELIRQVEVRTAELQHATTQLQEANLNLLQLSMVDGLTGIANRRVFDMTLQKEWERAQRSRTPLSIVIADVDYFKRLNDASGHQTGDDCLRLIAQAMAGTGRRSVDCTARFGGEEFVLLLPGADEAQAAALAEGARQGVEKIDFPHPDSPVGAHVTISLGLATANGNNFADAHALVGAADEALYAAKRHGRNRVVSSSSRTNANDLQRIASVHPANAGQAIRCT